MPRVAITIDKLRQDCLKTMHLDLLVMRKELLKGKQLSAVRARALVGYANCLEQMKHIERVNSAREGEAERLARAELQAARSTGGAKP